MIFPRLLRGAHMTLETKLHYPVQRKLTWEYQRRIGIWAMSEAKIPPPLRGTYFGQKRFLGRTRITSRGCGTLNICIDNCVISEEFRQMTYNPKTHICNLYFDTGTWDAKEKKGAAMSLSVPHQTQTINIYDVSLKNTENRRKQKKSVDNKTKTRRMRYDSLQQCSTEHTPCDITELFGDDDGGKPFDVTS